MEDGGISEFEKYGQESGRIEQYIDHINTLSDNRNQKLDRL
jgi:hypothetical protein